MVELGKYAFVVLSAYGLTMLALVLLVAVTWVQARKTRADLEAAEARRDARRAGSDGG